MIAFAGGGFIGDGKCRGGDVVDVDKRAYRMSAAVQAQLATEFDEKDRARNDAVELLARPVNVGRACPSDGEIVLLEKRAQMQIAGGA